MKDRDYVLSCLVKAGYLDAARAILDNNDGATGDEDHTRTAAYWRGIKSGSKNQRFSAAREIETEMRRRNKTYERHQHAQRYAH